jgi:hypothetical protein
MTTSIALQLEHLAFVKAKTFHRNHHMNNTLYKERTRSTKHMPVTARNMAIGKYLSLVVVLRLNPDTLYSFWDQYLPTTPQLRRHRRKRPSDHIDDDDDDYQAIQPKNSAGGGIDHGELPHFTRATRRRITAYNDGNEEIRPGKSNELSSIFSVDNSLLAIQSVNTSPSILDTPPPSSSAILPDVEEIGASLANVP